MKKLLIIALLIYSVNLFSQISEGGLPPSFQNNKLKGKSVIGTYLLSELDTAQLLAYDQENPTPMRYGVIQDVSLDLKLSGTKTYLEDYKGNIWRYRIEAKEAKSLQLIFEKYRVPDGAQLFVYDKNYSIIRGAFTNINITDDLTFTLADFPGEYVVIEYFEPENAEFEGEVVIGGIGQAYIDIYETKSGNADSYNLIEVNCIEGKEWQDQKHSVCKITFNDGTYSYLCTGALINNTKNDGKPYFLTANHCISSNSMASTVVAWFNYETAGCSTLSIYSGQTLTGASLKSTGSASDYTLLLLTNTVPVTYKPYFAGWSIANEVTDSTAGIHHPKGWSKKISIDHDPSFSNTEPIPWEGGSTTAAGTHWGVTFDEGTTYGGSSGSPLFDENKRIIGQLHGGSVVDYYGKLSYSWTHPSSAYTLKSFLDPTSSEVLTLDSYNPANKPDPQFSSGFSAVCVASPVELTGYSAFTPLTWKWSFDPVAVTYKNGTSSTSQNPVVTFDNNAAYNVSLTVTNSAGSTTRSVPGFISSGTALNIRALPSGITDSCSRTFTGVNLQAYGADAFLWELTGEAASYFSITNTTANPVEVKPISPLDKNIVLTLSLTGIQGTCSSTISYELPLEGQSNDNIADAIEITASRNGPFSNKCATIETGEPVPNHTECTGQLSWCDEYGDGTNVVENSVWFYFIPTYTKYYDISSTGFDNQLAVYQADSYSDILTGTYTILAANDDLNTSNYNPYITDVQLTAGKTYWIQVDGSGGGQTGVFNLTITGTSAIEDVEYDDINLSVYPQPACDIVHLESPEFEGVSVVLVELYNSAGTKVSSINDTEGDATIDVPLSGLSSGVYYARITFKEKRTTVKIVK